MSYLRRILTSIWGLAIGYLLISRLRFLRNNLEFIRCPARSDCDVPW